MRVCAGLAGGLEAPGVPGRAGRSSRRQPGAKKPLVRWTAVPGAGRPKRKWGAGSRAWPDAGVAVVLGPVSGLFVIDVDGPEAARGPVEPIRPRAGRPQGAFGQPGPSATTVLSATRPRRPAPRRRRGTRSSSSAATGDWSSRRRPAMRRGIAIPGKAGGCFNTCRSDSPAVITAQLAAIASAKERPKPKAQNRCEKPLETTIPTGEGSVSPSTTQFLSGVHADGPGWNEKLFQAAWTWPAGVLIETAEPPLLDGARPWDDDQKAASLRTIRSAFDKPRRPGRK